MNDESSNSKQDYESLIHSYGYNVNMNDNLSDDARQRILRDIIENEILAQEIVLSYLDSLIIRGTGSPKYNNAVKKWKADRLFVEQLWRNNKSVCVNSIQIIEYESN